MRLFVRVDDRLQPVRELAAAQYPRQADEAGEHRADGQNDQREGHHLRRFVQMLLGVMIGSALAVKSHEELAKHVEGRQAGAAHGEKPDRPMTVRSRQPENFILGEKPGERRKAGNRQHGNKKRYERDRHPVL